jgi:beta-lactamase superfamily II metal-dependent hydrolase
MQLVIFNVGHGFCALATASTGSRILFDCGHDEATGFRPSQFFKDAGVTRIDKFVLGNYDTDHASDLHNLVQELTIKRFVRNRSIDPDQLRKLKLQAGPLSEGIAAAIKLHRTYRLPIWYEADYGRIELRCFWNKYPEFTDTNNLSVISFLQCDDLTILIPGDLERAGWQAMLLDREFVSALKSVNVLIASHHGRDSGYCEEIFQHCKPELVIISDGNIQYETQEHCYRDHVSGKVCLVGERPCKRYVLSTRKDGNIIIEKHDESENAVIRTQRVLPELFRRPRYRWI